MKESVCLDPRLCGGTIYSVWVKVVLETEENCEKRSFEMFLCTRDMRQSKKITSDVVISEHVRFVTKGYIMD